MAESARSAAVRRRWKVTVKGWPVMGFVDQHQQVYPSVPVAPHYRRPIEDRDSDIPDEWFTAEQLDEYYGLKAADIKKWRRRKRVRTDLTSALFKGAVVETDAHGTELHAREVFRREYNLTDTTNANWSVEAVSLDTPVGPCDPVKMRGLLQASS